jgi:small nuclear ribonucleoprotein (snRNP)-like protein
MASVPLEDIFDELTSETQRVMRGSTAGSGGGNVASSELTSSTIASINYDPDSDFSIPLQVLQHALKHSLLVSVETVQGYLYQGTLTALDPYCNLTLDDVSVYRRRVPHVDFKQGSALLEKGTSMGYRSSVMVRAPQIVLVELPEGDLLKNAYVHMARSVRRYLQKQRKLASTGPPTAGAAAATAAPSAASAAAGADRKPQVRGGHGSRPGKKGQQGGDSFPRRKSNAKKVLFKKAKK